VNQASGLFALLVGLLLGAIFFGGLWWTVRAGTAGRNRSAWFPLSLVLRATLVMTGLYYVAGNGWQALLLCSGGILIARAAIFRLIRAGSLSHHAS
jgi:F1F0 ATPase subunit 2